MKLVPDCYDCLKNLARQAAGLATQDPLLRQRAIEEGIKILDNDFSYDELSIVIATKIHGAIKEITGNPDPYRAMKERELSLAKTLYAKIKPQYRDDFKSDLRFAAVANAIDFFREPNIVREDMRRPVNFAIDDSEQIEARLKKGGRVLYLADNIGEIYFDLPLFNWMKRFAHVTYVVKPLPVQNDASLDDIREAGLEDEFGSIMTTGVASPGIVFALASEEFKQEFEAADLIFAKGMGHYESLSELPLQGKFFHCLMAKCRPVANSIGVPMNSYVAMLQ